MALIKHFFLIRNVKDFMSKKSCPLLYSKYIKIIDFLDFSIWDRVKVLFSSCGHLGTDSGSLRGLLLYNSIFPRHKCVRACVYLV